MSLIYNATFDSQTRVLSLLDKAGNVISSCEVPSKRNELTLTATADNSSVKLIKNGSLSNTFEVNAGSGWTAYEFGTVINLNAGESCKWRCKSHPTTQSYGNYIQFVMTGKIEASGEVFSMLSMNLRDVTTLEGYGMAFGHLFEDCTSLIKAPQLPATTLIYFCYSNMFSGCTSLTSAPQLPATTLAGSCYYAMFSGCTALTSAPQLPATTLADYCYTNMFNGCTALTSAPQLPATTLANRCYYYMFSGCTSLTSAPQLPATTLADHCYSYMFSDCTSLTSAPQLPATTLADSCYYAMFSGCTSLTSAPQLPATTLVESCYTYMFGNCSKLKEVRVSATTTATDALKNWLYKVSATGDFYCDPNAAIFPTGISGIPSGWTRRDINLINALTLTATADNSSVKLTKNGTLDNTFEVDTGNGWTAYEFGTVITLNAGQSCKWRCSAHPTTQSYYDHVQFVMTGAIEASGNVNSMLDGANFRSMTSLSGYDRAFYSLFKGCASLTKAPYLPATTLDKYCYASLFYGCTSLTHAPALPATTLEKSCYAYMFDGCTSLTQAPALPATTLVESCYAYMFDGCTSLTQAPNLPATTLYLRCYEYMFNGCTSLTQAPDLPSTTLGSICYSYMFKGCIALTKAPYLPATTLVTACYQYMFYGCSSLAEVRISATTTTSDALKSWLSGVAASGTVYADPSFTELPENNASGIPSGWTRKPLSDYPNP